MIVPDGHGCFDAWVWHDGKFPFDSEADPFGEIRNPAHVHHCDPAQFRAFADAVEAGMKRIQA